ncbi:MAG: response regulator, partial [Gemmataceae bacterium]
PAPDPKPTPAPAASPEARPSHLPAAESVVLPPLVIPREPISPGDENPLYDLFREEVRVSALLLQDGLLDLGKQTATPETMEGLIRATHSLRGAAKIVGLDQPSRLAAAMETTLSTLHQGSATMAPATLPALHQGTALLVQLIDVQPEEAQGWIDRHQKQLLSLLDQIENLTTESTPSTASVGGLPSSIEEEPIPVVKITTTSPGAEARPAEQLPGPASSPVAVEPAEAVVRVTAQSLNRLMSLAGESLVQARWLQPFSMALLKLKKHQDRLAGLLESLSDQHRMDQGTEHLQGLLEETRKQATLCRQVLGERMREFEDQAGQAEDLNSRLYREVIVSRMRPFADGAHGFPRLVRDMARNLGKQVKLDIQGMTTEVDRDILEKLEVPLMHLLRNAVDHGIETPELRKEKGKPEQGTIRLEVVHRAGMLAITVRDAGRGVDLPRLQRKIVERGLTTNELASTMSEAELLEFLFLPGLSTAREVTEYSGRGVGLDVVQDSIRKVGGSVRITSVLDKGTTFHLQLPITLSVLRAVLVDIAGEPFAFPHNRIDRLLRVPRSSIRSLEHRQFIHVDGQNVGLVLAAQLLDLVATEQPEDEVPVVLMSDGSGLYGLIVDAFRGEQDLVVRPLDRRLGKVPNVSAAAILDDGAPVLIADIEDLIRSMDHFIQSGTLRRYDAIHKNIASKKKRILVVDDSITVREVERQLLRSAGYEVDVAVDGQDGWNQARTGMYDMIVSDIDMPRMTGLEFLKALRNHEQLRNIPVVIVSYKDREAERRQGLELGANYYLTKSSFHDNRFLQTVRDLIGGPEGEG